MTPQLHPFAFAALLRRITRPGRYCPKVARVLATPAPWRIVNDLRIAAFTADLAIEKGETMPRRVDGVV